MRRRQKAKKLICTALVFAMITAFAVHASAISLIYDDLPYTGADPLILENGVTYVSVRGLLNMRDSFEASWTEITRTGSFLGIGLDLIAVVGENHIVANGEAIHTGTPIRLLGGRVYVPVRALAKALGAEVSYDGKTSTVALKTKENYIGRSTRAYSDEDFYWMARIISSESCDEPYAGKLMVGNVVLNRKNSAQFPNTVYSVIFDRTNAVQFTTPRATSARKRRERFCQGQTERAWHFTLSTRT